jgi:hypothetical protein
MSGKYAQEVVYFQVIKASADWIRGRVGPNETKAYSRFHIINPVCLCSHSISIRLFYRAVKTA